MRRFFMRIITNTDLFRQWKTVVWSFLFLTNCITNKQCRSLGFYQTITLEVTFEGMADVSRVYRHMYTVVVSDFAQVAGGVIKSRRQPSWNVFTPLCMGHLKGEADWRFMKQAWLHQPTPLEPQQSTRLTN